MPTYRVRPGFRHGAGKRFGPGDLVELTEREAAGFLDKLELVEDGGGPLFSAELRNSLNPGWGLPHTPDAVHVIQLPGLDQATVEILEAAGYATSAQLDEATDGELLAVRGIGPGRLAAIQEALSAWRTG